MQCLCIGVNDCAESVKEYITNELEKLNISSKDCTVIDSVDIDGSTSVICTINQEEKYTPEYEKLILSISNGLADYIIKEYEEKLLLRIINSNYCYFNSIEKKEILRLALLIIKNDDKNFLNSLFQIRRRNIIIKKLVDYFESSNKVILDGFVNFRLKDYIKDLEEIVDKAVDEFLTEREYKEFIRLLRYFVDIQEPKFNVIHVLVDYDNKYILLDEKKKEITNECIQEFMSDIPEGEINYDDLLVSSLITMAPKKVIIHSADNFRNKELLETIKNVFWGKAVICPDCELCSVKLVRSENKS
ncbi:putative sporulation protein YtxC [Acetivibrio clariflavus]|uniref:Putative sporulation protein YtxC n=1 Tax=Acetivibrio clariflavus (strain DSM 19732 / NBRC 101661 / EBR45) TaxID=720554 RepID=G8M3A2_ACECE|nr:putative sporulation protein YtxC [Acetivibrio clariflavus]AEV70422.1 putative sporulation protein YtxC [Acetivibrio clariflavus DSM 19732]